MKVKEFPNFIPGLVLRKCIGPMAIWNVFQHFLPPYVSGGYLINIWWAPIKPISGSLSTAKAIQVVWSHLSLKKVILSTVSLANATRTCLVRRSSSHFQCAFSVMRQLYLSVSSSLFWNKIFFHLSSTLWNDSPHSHWSLGHWWSDLRRKGDSLPSGVQGNPSLHIAVSEEWPCVKELWIIDLIKVQMLRIQCLLGEKLAWVQADHPENPSTFPRTEILFISTTASLQNLYKNKNFWFVNSIFYSCFTAWGNKLCLAD